LLALWRALLQTLNDWQKLRWPTKRGKGTKWMVLVDGTGTPLGAYLDAATPAEVTLLKQTLASMPLKAGPSGSSPIAGTTATPCAGISNGAGFSRSFPRGPPTRRRLTKMAVCCAAAATAGSSNGR